MLRIKVAHGVLIIFSCPDYIAWLPPDASKIFVERACPYDVPLHISLQAVVGGCREILFEPAGVDGPRTRRNLRAAVVQGITDTRSTGILIVASRTTISCTPCSERTANLFPNVLGSVPIEIGVFIPESRAARTVGRSSSDNGN